jgi:glycosyltransferase involved in cell wall biosynthesis
MAVRLSILICTMPNRSAMLQRLLDVLKPQLTDDVELNIDCTEDIAIGQKRQDILESAKGEYVAFVDDDDLVSSDYVQQIIQAVTTQPDCVGIRGVIMHFGNWPRLFTHSLECGAWVDTGDEYFRTPNHLNPIKRELALDCGGFSLGMNFGEDLDFSKRVHPFLLSEVMVDSVLYYYLFNKKMVALEGAI